MYKDFPFSKVVKKAEQLAREGHYVHQKFTCAGCGQRLTMEQPNHFYEEGTCDRCPKITDIKKQGCNFMLHISLTEKGLAERDNILRVVRARH